MTFPTFGRADYDPHEIASDGPFTAPRVWLHFQKILVGLSVYAVANAIVFGVMPTRFPWWLAFAVGPAINIAATVLELIRRTDPRPHTIGEHVTDGITDIALYSVPAVLYYVHLGLWFMAAVFAAFLYLLYRSCRNGARP